MSQIWALHTDGLTMREIRERLTILDAPYRSALNAKIPWSVQAISNHLPIKKPITG